MNRMKIPPHLIYSLPKQHDLPTGFGSGEKELFGENDCKTHQPTITLHGGYYIWQIYSAYGAAQLQPPTSGCGEIRTTKAAETRKSGCYNSPPLETDFVPEVTDHATSPTNTPEIPLEFELILVCDARHTPQLRFLGFLGSFPEPNTDPVLQIVGARLLPFTPIHVRSESRSKAPKLLLAGLTTHTPIPAYANTLLEP
ncbi:hypothetical protein LXL04_019770 [Taraxacum kok-saghyz]